MAAVQLSALISSFTMSTNRYSSSRSRFQPQPSHLQFDRSVVRAEALENSSTVAEPVEVEVPPGGCAACGKAEKVGGCNGEGRIQGGIGAVPGFGWWPIKAFRPCPAFVEAGGKYRRVGQSLDEVAFGRAGVGDNLDISDRLKGK